MSKKKNPNRCPLCKKLCMYGRGEHYCSPKPPLKKPFVVYLSREDLEKQLAAEWNDPERWPQDVKLEVGTVWGKH